MGKIGDKIDDIERLRIGLHDIAKQIVGDNEMFLAESVAEQMYEKGQDGYGKSLGHYTPYTIAKKRAKGQRYDHITLRDTRAFHNALRVVLDDDGFYLESGDWKSEKWIIPRWSESIFRPDAETLTTLKNIILDDLRDEIKKQI